MAWQASKAVPAPTAVAAAPAPAAPAPAPAPANIAPPPRPEVPVQPLASVVPAPEKPAAAAGNTAPAPISRPAPDNLPPKAAAPVQEAKASPPPLAAKLPVAPAPAALPAPPAILPTFDIVRVEPSGDVLVAGRGQPGAAIALVEGDQVLGQGNIDANGQFVLLPPNLKAGSHLLALKMLPKAGKPVLSTQSVAVSVASKANGGVVVALAEPGQPTQVLSDPPPAQPKVTSLPPVVPATPEVNIRTVEAEQGGGFFATGQASAGASVRLYLNSSFVAALQAGANGRWSLKITRGLRPGAYAVRADQVDAGTGAVVARAEVPFDFPPEAVPVAQAAPVKLPAKEAPTPPVVLADAAAAQSPDATIRGIEPPPPKKTRPGAAPPPPAAAALPDRPVAVPAASLAEPPNAAPSPNVPAPEIVAAAPPPAGNLAPDQPPAPLAAADVVIREIQTATVVRGDSLWRISRQNFGQGIRYTQIYEANASQIRDPGLIFPGQVLVVPSMP